MSWNLERPRELVQKIIAFDGMSPEDQLTAEEILQRIDGAMKSVGRRIEYAQYHYFQAKDLQTLRNNRIEESGSPAAARITYSIDYPEDRIGAEAHIIACLQNTHALFDLFLFGAYHALFINSGGTFLPSHEVAWRKVGPALKRSSETAALHAGLESLRGTDEFKYLEALVNSSKHRAVIRTRHWIVVESKDDEGSPPRFNEFEFNGATYARQEALPSMARAWGVVTHAVIKSGLELERILRGRLGL